MLSFRKGTMYEGDLVFRSTNGGAFWQAVTGLPLNRNGRGLAAAPTASGTVYALGDSSYEQYVIYKSEDWGDSWWDITTGLPTGYRATIAASALGPEFLYVGTAAGLFAAKFPAIDDDGDGYTETDGDCDDTDPSVNPGAIEVCNGIDDNCDGSVDEGCVTYYRDADGDGYGDPYEYVVATSQPGGYVTDNTDPDDSNLFDPPQPVKGDVNGDGLPGLEDAIIALQVCAGITVEIEFGLDGDINEDSKIGMTEAIHALQKAAEVR
ncbi:MAG: putative metal-binding motif-containing protein [candidate division Zixibacteria bacterium]|nr:putative metal-binding motif-containing protein [candidate division Zixibacteria bacterium]